MSVLELQGGTSLGRPSSSGVTSLGRPSNGGVTSSGLGRPGFASEPVVGGVVRVRGWGGRWSDLDGGFSVRLWDAWDVLSETAMRLAYGVPGLLLSALRNVAPRVVDRRVTVNLEHVTVYPGATFVVGCPTGDHSHFDHAIPAVGPGEPGGSNE
jgi:hypothetical protein